MIDVAAGLANRVQLTTDGHRAYLMAVDDAFGSEIDYAQLIKVCGTEDSRDENPTARRYSPQVCTGIEVNVVQGDPDPDHISTSYIERQNLTMRMSMRRFTRLTNAFSKKVTYHAAGIALHFLYVNFARPHKSLANPLPSDPGDRGRDRRPHLDARRDRRTARLTGGLCLRGGGTQPALLRRQPRCAPAAHSR